MQYSIEESALIGGLIAEYFSRASVSETLRMAYYGMSEPKVKSMLYRTRQGLKEYLEKEGYEL